jgi:2-polyprenyl-3-methyl-5-hydroxy-6-metoxy-1,4-benzoquinol methylase
MTTGQTPGQLWGERARDYADYAEEAFRPIFVAILDVAGVTAGTRLLDVGCGTGLATAIAAERGVLVAGLDEAERSLAIAKERATAKVIIGGAETTPGKSLTAPGWPRRPMAKITFKMLRR